MLILTQKCRANPSDLDQTHVIHLCTRACVENILLLMSTYKNIQHILIAIHLYTFWKRKHTFMLKVLRQTLHLIYILNICYHKLPTHTRNIYTIQTFIVSLTLMHIGKLFTLCTYLHSKGNPVLSYIHLGSDLNIPSPFAKNFMPLIFTYVYTLLQGVFHATSM